MRSAFVTAALLAFLLAPSTVPAQPIFYVTSDAARAIAGDNGIAIIYRLRLDEGVWKIEGRDVNGRYVYMRIDPRTGDVVRLDRGW